MTNTSGNPATGKMSFNLLLAEVDKLDLVELMDLKMHVETLIGE